MQIRAIAAINPPPQALVREPEAAPRHERRGTPEPHVLEGEFIAGGAGAGHERRSHAERTIHAEWWRAAGRGARRAQPAAGGAEAYERVATLGSLPRGSLDVYA